MTEKKESSCQINDHLFCHERIKVRIINVGT